MERFFPGHQIRLVAIADRYDSDRYDCYFGTYALKNFFNEWYRKDIAGKVSLVKAEQKKEGSFLGSHARYGYTIVSYPAKENISCKRNNHHTFYYLLFVGTRLSQHTDRKLAL